MLKAKPLIFIHIPKTAGTSMRALLSTQTKNKWGEILEGVNNAAAEFGSLNTLIHHKHQYTSNYDEYNFINKSHLHIPTNELWEYWINNIKDKSTNNVIELHFDIVNMNPIPNDLYKNNLYKNLNWMTILRDPVERVISEYFYFRDLYSQTVDVIWHEAPPTIFNFNGFYNSIDMGNNIIEYAESEFSKNCYLKWFLGKKYLSDDLFNDNDVDNVIDIMESLNFKVGILERLNDSIEYWNNAFGFNLKYEDMGQIKINKNKPTISKEEKDIIRKNNKLDIKLYNYYLDKLNSV